LLRYKLTPGKTISSKYEIVIYWSQEDQTFIAEAPESPAACLMANLSGSTLNVETIFREWIETARESGRLIPEPKGKLMYASEAGVKI